MWFVSGLVMVYVPYPSWRDEERVAALRPLDVARIAVAPGEALAKSGIGRTPTVFRLEMWGCEPVYRIVDFGRPTSVSAVDGRIIAHVGSGQAAAAVRATFPASAISYLGRIDADQWSVSGLLAPHRPLHLFALADGRETELYVSSLTGEIVQSTTRKERLWNWLGAVPHWIFFTPIRKDGALWREVILWSAGAAAAGAVLGIWIGIMRIRLRPRYPSGRVSPYRGWMLWHHVAGVAGGGFLAAWLLSGWLSVAPFGLFGALPVTPDDLARYYGPGKPRFVMPLAVLRAVARPDTKEITFSWLQSAPLAIVDDGSRKRVYDAQTGVPVSFMPAKLEAAAAVVFPRARVVASERLEQPDTYWYSHLAQRPLPALRVRFDDPGATWLMIDLTTARIVGVSTRSDRIYRWAFNFVHQYDLPALLTHPYLRALLIWSLALLGIVVSLSGVVIGVRSLRRR
jgi:hypothetical protein